MAAFGLTEDDYATEEHSAVIDVWPDVWPALRAFMGLRTQWRVGFSGATGLDYAVIPFVLRMHAVARADWPGVFDDIGVMEQAAKKAMSGSDSDD